MHHVHLHPELLMQMLCKMLRRIHATVLSASTSEREHEACKSTFDISFHMGVCQFVDAVQEGENLTIVFQETNYRLVKTRKLLVRLITTGAMGGAAVENIASAVSRLVSRYALTTNGPLPSYLENVAGPSCGFDT